MSFIELCRQFIAIDTSPQAGTREGARWLQKLALSYGLKVDFQEETFGGQEQANIFIRTSNKKIEEFLLQSHFDTANSGSPSLWTENLLNPFNAIIRDGKIYGLGACEAKLDLLCKLEALRSFSQNTEWNISPVIVGTYGEEIGMAGMLRAIRKNKFSAKFALVGEPSGHQLIYAGKGYAVLDFYIQFSNEERDYRIEHNLKESVSTQTKFFKGKALHSSDGTPSENAINKAIEYLLQIPASVVLMDIEGGTNHNTVANDVILELDFYAGVQEPMVKKLREIYMVLQQISSEFLIHKDSDFNPAYPTMNLGLIKSHEDHVHLTVACRFPPSVSEDQYQIWLNKLQLSALSVGGQCQVSDYKRPYRTDLDSEFVKICQEILSTKNLKTECITKATCTEMSLLARKGIISLGFGAGLRNQSTSISSEYVNIKDLEVSIDFYRTIIERVCL